MGSSESKQIEARLLTSSLDKAKFNKSFNLYYESMRYGLKFVIGQHRNEPSNIISLPLGWYGDLILYSGPGTDSDPLAVVKYGNRMATFDEVRLPPKGPGQELIKEEIRCHLNGMNFAYTFAVAVGESGHPERFEWRSSKTEEVRELGEVSRGRKLVRLNHGDEVVAVWSWTRLRWTVNKGAAFSFTNSGATGELGNAFAIMAVTSFVRQYQKDVQASIRA
ncbi:uncharacterized protein MAM_06850 [Metarhizium album ARSEF 1941]|uniref:ATP synthase alpha chain n=1 Tax=Metarhizium album (strain ARSEF 1941) TaxID=1081103 RepID=A0A0B2WH74_METAS|nr:uncharacterized protein MAM_06850 [Metarhizium album ARSEF 1941]KHN95346.1 hypothetical protein MAM_06850 [Metarhizium album ARSEF 1941]